MFNKVSNFFEAHIEKIVLAIVGLVCIWILIFRVLISPNAVSYGDGKFNPSEIDKHIQEQAKELEHKLNQPPEPKMGYVSRLTGFLDPNNPVREGIWGDLQHGFDGLFASAISGIKTDLSIPLPPPISTEISSGKEYALPLTDGVIGEVTDVAVEHIRAAAYVPTLQVTEDIPYESAAPEPNDIDLITVEAKFEVEELYRKFRENFTGLDVRLEWRDPCLAVPIFAAVQLQRQELLDDGGWSDWQDVPRSKIDHRKRMFEIIEDVESLPAGRIKVRLLQFNEPDMKMDLLQPQTYQIASANKEWFPPLLYRRFLELQKKEKAEQKREEIEARKEEEERDREQRIGDRRGGTFGARSGTGRLGGGAVYEGYGGTEGLRGTRGTRQRGVRGDRRTGQTDMGLYGDMGPGSRGAGSLYGDRGPAGGRQRRSRGRGREEREGEMDYFMGMEGREIRRGPSTDDVYYEFEDILITELTDLSKWREPLVFWAHDDTVEPGKSYRYKIRLGVFNPIAGTNQFNQKYKSYKDKVILWSEFSDITESVDIPRRLYFFAKNLQEAAKKVTVQVSKYVLGYWYSEDFPVRQGEVIGKVVELEREESSEPRRPRTSAMLRDPRRLEYLRPKERTTEPENIDYCTEAVLVDAVAVNDWSGRGNLRPRQYFDMLYSSDGANIERMPIKAGNWPADLLTIFNEINSSQREPKEPLRPWQSGTGRTRRMRRAPTGEGREGYDEFYEGYDMMLEEMMGVRGPY